MKSKGNTLSIFTFLFFIFILAHASVCVGGILFEEDFEGKIDKNKWDLPPAWKIDNGVLDANGGEVGITVKNDFTDFELYCDFNMVAPLWSAEFVLRAQDKDNCYMFQIVADNRHQFWNHLRVGGQWQMPDANKVADESGVEPKLGEWYSVKIVVEGSRFDYHHGQRGKEPKLAFTWEDDTYKEGAIGFREGGGEHCLYDNLVVTTIGGAAIAPYKSLPTIWGKIKNGY